MATGMSIGLPAFLSGTEESTLTKKPAGPLLVTPEGTGYAYSAAGTGAGATKGAVSTPATSAAAGPDLARERKDSCNEHQRLDRERRTGKGSRSILRRESLDPFPDPYTDSPVADILPLPGAYLRIMGPGDHH
ncbi:hypothetical protein MRB53_036552 [Persea americana]|nr:hypothetical protein MRB53_037475 [Persea americana]KAJ8613872.1 hypothetical protein MRB53_036829 [Persea americana]KAJ8614686.1 hypothetical protein MRB53_036552 [Persea americana]